jgi:NAD(P)-dependent dehydrogenase (short-subunit alcohol dehydrogenase family)
MKETVIVTGSKGLVGRAVTNRLKNVGCRVIEADIVDGDDFNDEDYVKSFFKKNIGTALVNLFAMNDHVDGGARGNRLMDISLDSFDNYLKVNVTSLFSVCREFARNSMNGSIVNFTSTYGVVSPDPLLYDNGEKHIAYGVSKAAVIQLTKHLATHFAPNIRVNCVMPGGILNNQNKEFVYAYSGMVPAGRMMDVEEVCGIVQFLVSDDSSYCTGGVFPIDGGYTIW